MLRQTTSSKLPERNLIQVAKPGGGGSEDQSNKTDCEWNQDSERVPGGDIHWSLCSMPTFRPSYTQSLESL